MGRKWVINLLLVLMLAGCGANLASIADPYGKENPPGEVPTGDSNGNTSEPDSSSSTSDTAATDAPAEVIQIKTTMNLTPGA